MPHLQGNQVSLKGQSPWRGLGISHSDRILVTGASGWFGQTFLALLRGHPSVLCISSRPGIGLAPWSDQMINDFSPTVVANFAFLTKQKLAAVGLDAFVSTNKELTRRYLHALDRPDVRLSVTISSGAALASDVGQGYRSDNAYGALKAHEERAALARAHEGKVVLVARAFSVSGPYIRDPKDYALSSFVLQALRGAINVRADRPVFRRYTSVSDLLTVSLARAAQGWAGILESGGELIEMGDLAELVRDSVNVGATISRVPMTSKMPAVYASDNSSWTSACALVEITPKPLRQQIDEVREYLEGKRNGDLLALPPSRGHN